MYVGKQKYFNHDLSAVDILTDFFFYKITDIFNSVELNPCICQKQAVGRWC